MSYTVRFTQEAERDLLELHAFLAELDPLPAKAAIETLRKALDLLALFPFSCRKASGADTPRLREMVVSFGQRGYVMLFEIESKQYVTVIAVRHQREDDFF
ncbi:MAG: type II toxin-antitoxin system RelE/ParE family toxin [Deltaproteobacteria bacterium]|nr:type II toxin-antitoxin system RelE/ParE family toxin [Deltaproteobacteria bacterium]